MAKTKRLNSEELAAYRDYVARKGLRKTESGETLGELPSQGDIAKLISHIEALENRLGITGELVTRALEIFENVESDADWRLERALTNWEHDANAYFTQSEDVSIKTKFVNASPENVDPVSKEEGLSDKEYLEELENLLENAACYFAGPAEARDLRSWEDSVRRATDELYEELLRRREGH